MAEYQKIEYRIDKEGKITEKVIGVTGPDCTTATAGIEQALGQVESRELLPEYDQDGDDGMSSLVQSAQS
ncbi:hypothetical protein BST81_17770 [Leptolyngbya sp. 'hensonii']|uniref:DUF2997 domain-containing protein n=1 Tax=Leptolyngbya sp. 'hensonii' TaxID=1922337 RepID=UPI00094F5812|nr:DUF2997 domain-containing protein [Leptolyngbya sp. 'hensonii']OLP17196.1 hypothetical protein BST81_17770 [Leptolyngbya sp. 'hensonii']